MIAWVFAVLEAITSLSASERALRSAQASVATVYLRSCTADLLSQPFCYRIGSLSYASHVFIMSSDYIFILSFLSRSRALVSRLLVYRPHSLVVEPSKVLLSVFPWLGC